VDSGGRRHRRLRRFSFTELLKASRKMIVAHAAMEKTVVNSPAANDPVRFSLPKIVGPTKPPKLPME